MKDIEEDIMIDCPPLIDNRAQDILDELDDLEESTPLLSSYKPEKKKHKEEEDDGYNFDETNEWFNTLTNFKAEPIKKMKVKNSFFDDLISGKKKKKKKKKDGELTDFNMEFDKEINLLKNLLVDQNEFTTSLQKKYDALNNSKSSQRGIGKFTTDLITNINQARSLSMQLVEKTINTKKTIAELTMKEKKELSSKNAETEDMGMYASTYLKEMMNMGRKNIDGMGYNAGEYDDDVSPDELFDSVNDVLGGDNRPEELLKYLKYEDAGINIKAVIHGENLVCFKAYDKDGNVVEDYPSPNENTNLNINRSTGIATDRYNNKYEIEWV